MANRLTMHLRAPSSRFSKFIPRGITTYGWAKDEAWIRFYGVRVR